MALWVDGNAIAGLLGEAFDAEMTTVPRRCQSCHTISAVGAHRVYYGAGVVLRCPVCGDLAMRIATLPDRHVVRLQGEWTLQLRAS
jgi:predicted RNA-binding Zn-ribbon protein involved in translation (DUF1610 family)